MKKFIVSLATVSMAALLFTACNSGEKPADTATPATDATTTVTPDAKTDAKTTTPATTDAAVKTEVKTDVKVK